MWNDVGIARNDAGLRRAIDAIGKLRDEFWQNVRVPGDDGNLNKNLEFAGRVGDFLEQGELIARDALHRKESCGAHLREEHQTEDGEALRDDENFSYAAAWEYTGAGKEPVMLKEDLAFENVKLTQRSYK